MGAPRRQPPAELSAPFVADPVAGFFHRRARLHVAHEPAPPASLRRAGVAGSLLLV
jgi:hypothetical protein